MRRRLMKEREGFISISPDSPVTIEEAVAGDVLSYNITNHKYVLQKSTATINGEPIGIVVIPGNHNLWGDSSLAVVSLVPMNCDTPTTGGTAETGMTWGTPSTTVSGLTLYNKIVLTVSGTTPTSTASGLSNYSNIPSDQSTFVGSTCPTDSKTKWRYASDSTISPSPYNGTAFNTVYFQSSSPSSTANCLIDFKGKENTELLVSVRGQKDYTSWTPAATSDYCAASCCNMYRTVGTKQGDWYLPSAGEAGYLIARFSTINAAINTVGGVSIATDNYHWLSTGYDSTYSRLILLSNGSVTYGDKDSEYYCRAFMRIK